MVNMPAARNALFSLEIIGKMVLETQRFWASSLGVTVPQWGIIVAINELASERGVKVGEVARRLRVDSSFVTAQTKMLENSGHVIRRQSPEDARAMLLSLTMQAEVQLQNLAPRQNKLSEFLFDGIEPFEMRTLISSLQTLEKHFMKAELVLSLDE